MIKGGVRQHLAGVSSLGVKNAVAILLLGSVLCLSAASFLTLSETNVWWVRALDFPRPQFVVALPVLLIAALLLRRPSTAAGRAVVALGLAATALLASKLWPYSPPAGEAAVRVAACPPDSSLTLMIANVQRRNEKAEAFLERVSDAEPDVLLIMETDAWWDRRLESLGSRFDMSVRHIPDEKQGAYGMHLFSRLPLLEPEVRFLFGAFTPSVFTGIRLESGDAVQFMGLHPQPPLAWSQPTTLRDGHLLAAALEARSSKTPVILAGDLNALPWEAVVRRAVRIGGFLDPRLGRGLFPTFRTTNPAVSWPLDHLFFQDAFALVRFELLSDFGSDHLPVLAELCTHPPRGRDRTRRLRTMPIFRRPNPRWTPP